MFNFLKKKIDSFAEKVKGKLEKKEELIIEEQQKQPFLEKKVEQKTEIEEEKKAVLERLEEEQKKDLEERLEKEDIHLTEKEKELEEELSEEERKFLAEIREEVEKEFKEKDEQAKQSSEKVKSKEKKETQKIEEIEKIIEEREELIERAEETKKGIEVPKEEFAEKKVKEELIEEIIEEEGFEEKFEEELEKEIEEEFEKEPEKIETEKEIEFERKALKKIKIEEPKRIVESDLLKERELKAKVSLTSKMKKFFTGKIKIEEKDVKDFLEEFELALMEADVEQETSKKIVEGIKQELIGKEIDGRNVTETLKKEIALILEKLMDAPKIDLKEKMQSKKPFVILFLGPNGAGKTTSIAKIAFKFKKQGKQVILAAADTFRAASIEQIETHAERIGVRLVKHQYGSDPAAVAFDAVKAAEAKNMDLVLIDSAGRQETNTNLMNELKKIDRVVKPDLKLFVGEAMAGNSLYEQAKEFKEKIGFDGFILTKIDTDAKGGTAISLISGLQKPVVFVGTGQGYENLVEFTPKFITDRIIK